MLAFRHARLLIDVVCLALATGMSCSTSAGDAGTTDSAGQGMLTGQVLLGPTCPAVRQPRPPGCADQPYSAELRIETPDGTAVIAQTTSDAQGAFSISLPPGTYLLAPVAPGDVAYPRAAAQLVTVEAGAETSVIVQYDTGIR